MKGKEKRFNLIKSESESPDFFSADREKLKENTFRVPDNYFESLPGHIQDRIHSEKAKAPLRPFPRTLMYAAAAAALLVVIAFTLFLRSELNSRKSQLLSNNEYSLKNLTSKSEQSPPPSDSIRKSPVSVSQTEPAAEKKETPVEKEESGSKQTLNKVINNLEKEGVSDEDLMQYLLEENYDPIELTN